MEAAESVIQKISAWSGLAAVTIFCLAFLLSAFFPVPSPSWTPEAVAMHYAQHANGIRLGMGLLILGSVLFVPMVAVISLQMLRMKRCGALLSMIQLSAGSIGVAFIMIPAIFFSATAFRPDRNIDATYVLNDLSWIFLVIPWPAFSLQYLAIGLATVLDRPKKHQVFPRWLGFFNLWLALVISPAALIPFFKTGPFAWNGLLTFWMPGGMFVAWSPLMLYVLLKAIQSQIGDDTASVDGARQNHAGVKA